MIEGQKCGDCIHYHPNPKATAEPAGQCRCNPPQIVILHGESDQPQVDSSGTIHVVKKQVNEGRSMFPNMVARDPGCGEFSLAINSAKLHGG